MDTTKKRSRSTMKDSNPDVIVGNDAKKFKEQRQRNDDYEKLDLVPRDDDFFNTIHIYIVKAGIEKARYEIFTNQVKRFGGTVVEFYDENVFVSHILVDDKMDAARLLRLLNLKMFPKTTVVKSMWLSLCLKQKKLLDSRAYELKPVDEIDYRSDTYDKDVSLQHNASPDASSTKNGEGTSQRQESSKVANFSPEIDKSNVKPNIFQDDSDYEHSDDEDIKSEVTSSSTSSGRKPLNVNSWICAQSSKSPKPNVNSHITAKLEEMVKAYESTNDKWRAFGYQKAIQALRRHPKEISSWEEAKSLPGVGGRLADKIWEIAQSGELRKLTEFKSSEEVNVLQIFNNVWGAGPHTAQLWYQQGFRTIQDLQEKANLNHQQKVGVRLYDDLLERMPREEASEIEKVVKEAAESLLSGVVAQACGSYRRGKATCGDVDILVTHPDGKSHKGLFAKLLSKLKENGFLTDDLVTAEDSGNQKKYLGVCKLPGSNTKHRRLDIIVVPYNEYGCALVYFTGSAHFNRSLRHLCKKQNMSLNEHALKIGVVRKGTEKIYEGSSVSTPTEEDVFKALKIPYRPPEERDH